MSRRKNNFTKAMSHLKSTQIDEKINQLEEQPTNNTMGLMTVADPSQWYQPPDVEVPELDFNLGNDDDDGKDTRGIFNDQGEILTIEPDVGDTSYILGPMASMWYGWGNFSTFGYIRESDRKMVNLGRITGKLSNWDGVSNFISYGQLTLEQAVWFWNTPKKDNAGNDPDNANYRAFYPGPPSNIPDQYGRYLCTITGTPKLFDKTPPGYVTNPTQGPESASDQFSAQMYNNSMTPDQFWNQLLKRIKKVGFENLTDMEKEFYNLYSMSDDGQDAANEFIKYMGNEANKPEYANFWQKMGKAGEVFGKFLFNALPDVIDNDTLGDSYINSIVKKMTINDDGTLNFGDNILGTTQVPYVNSAGQLVVDYNYNFKNNADELAGKKDKLSYMQKTFGPLVYGYLGKYSADASPKTGDPTGLVDMMLGSVFSKAIETSKAFGGAQDKKGQLILDIDQLPTRIKKSLGLGEYGDPSNTGTNTNPSGFNAQASSQGTTVNWGGGMGSAVIVAGNYGALQNWEKSILQNGLKVKSGSSYDNELKRLKKMYPGFVPQAKTIPINNTQVAHYEPQGTVLTESRKRILREIKKPYKVPKIPTKFKGIRPKVRVTGKGLMEVPEIPKQFKPEPTIWRKHNYDKNVRSSQEKKNEVLEYVGAAADHWEYLTETRRKEKNAKRDAFYSTKKDRDFLYDYWYGGKKHKVTRKEDIDNDCLVYIEDEDGKKFSMLQSKLNEMIEQEQMKDVFDSYIPEEEQGAREKNFDKVTRLKSIVGKIKRGDIGPEYPNEPPPELINGWHPKFGKKYKHDKLDPQSAEAMPDTGNPEIDVNIKKATDSKSKARKLKTLLGKKA